MMCECVGNKDDFKIALPFKTISEFNILHTISGKGFIERVLPQKLCFQRDIACVEVFPVGTDSAQQVIIGRLDSAFFEPAHEFRDRLSGFAPARKSQTGHLYFGPLPMQFQVLGDETR